MQSQFMSKLASSLLRNASRVLILATLVLAGCSSDDITDFEEDKSAEELFQLATEAVERGEIGDASTLFDEVERQHPYSRLASQAQLMSAWALYESNNYTAAIGALDRFIELNPAHKNVDYAYYLKAQSYYERIVDVERDADMTVKAAEAFDALITRFPESKYASDSRLKLDLTRSHLAGKEMAVGRFYLQRKHYDAALRRFTLVIRDYDTSNQTPEALYRMVEAYLGLGLDSEAERSGAVLKFNYPDSIWTERMLNLIEDPTADPEPELLERLLETTKSVF